MPAIGYTHVNKVECVVQTLRTGSRDHAVVPKDDPHDLHRTLSQRELGILQCSNFVTTIGDAARITAYQSHLPPGVLCTDSESDFRATGRVQSLVNTTE